MLAGLRTTTLNIRTLRIIHGLDYQQFIPNMQLSGIPLYAITYLFLYQFVEISVVSGLGLI